MKCLFLTLLAAEAAFAARVKDIAWLKGDRVNQLVGYGIVSGLGGTGDKFGSEGGIGQYLKGMGVDLKSQLSEVRNTAQVMVSAELPAFTNVGNRIDVLVSSIGNATSLEGGTLLMTPLKGADGAVYAVAQGRLTIERRKDARGALVSQALLTGTVIHGAVLEKVVPVELPAGGVLVFSLFQPDFTTAARMAVRMNEELGGKYATAVSASRIEVIPPYEESHGTVDLVSILENIDVEADRRAKVVISQSTGTVVMGERVTVAPVVISHGNLRLEVSNPVAQVTAREKSLAWMPKGAMVADVASGLNELGATPDDIIAILTVLKSSGALMAELEVR